MQHMSFALRFAWMKDLQSEYRVQTDLHSIGAQMFS